MQHIRFNQHLQVTPSKIICIGRNYVEHIHELGNDIPDEMVVFIKPNSAINNQLNSVHLQQALHYEAELCFVVENGLFTAVGLGLDLTKRQLQSQLKSKALPWERAKAFNGSAVFTDFLSIKDVNPQNGNWSFSLTIDGQLTQLGHSQLMIYSPSDILADISDFLSLENGDIVMTGTPKGVGEVSSGRVFELTLWHGIEYQSEEQLIQDTANTKPLLKQQWVAI
ncbi:MULTISPECIES: fumarylacetoacetate hydrolase family protein [Pseudomonadati]|uniref:Fumarylacetoacetate hydrolase family protein n=1 Tax=Shewanella aestuarii TaxID=1028752 RepID=A0ABT0L503_9GAMM|nr:fumarylacetoacetate hydrolase family protein [Shewanella aestuarii]MCL1118813.1 fumarylacetoacetate hydrolase family protein [Shewanella aestuarii]GGN83621.1 2-keto-4-pentenoate hydratase [Shewanella aestuarii]